MINIRKRGEKNGGDLISRRKFLKFGGTVAIGAGRPKQILAYKGVTRGEVRSAEEINLTHFIGGLNHDKN